MLSCGRVRRALQPLVLKYWLNQRSQTTVSTRVAGMELEVFPSVFHPRYFGSSAILAKFVSSLDLNGKSFLEIGCGSGVVSLCAARAGARVTAVDINPEAVRCTIANAARNGLNLDVRLSDLFSTAGDERFDVIAWNPPFLPRMPNTAAECAFYGGPNFEVIRRFCEEVSNHIHAGGAIYTIVSGDVDIPRIELFFRDQGFAISRVQSKRWGLGETMVILCAKTAGILDMMTAGKVEALQPFLDAYDRVRKAEAWGGDDLDLPFHPKRHLDIWHIRQRTFRTFERIIAPLPRGIAVDVGAGSCWMTRYLDRWGFDAIAIDINASDSDGLRAGQKYINEGAAFQRIRAGMERLPFASGTITLLATNAAFHYASDARAALSEFLRVLTPGGKVVIIDSPFYENAVDGERMIADRVKDFGQKYEMPEALARHSGYLTFQGLEELLRSMDLRWQFHAVWPGFRRKYEELYARLQGRRLAQFPIVVIESKR